MPKRKNNSVQSLSVALSSITSELRELLFTLYMYSSFRPSVWVKVTSDNWNLRNLRYNKEICHVMLASITTESVPITSNYPSKTLKPRLLDNFEVCSLFSRKQQQIFITCRWHVKFGISVPDYPSSNVETTFLGQFYVFTF